MTIPTTVHTLGADNRHEISNVQLWTGRIMSTLPALFLVWDGVMKLLRPPIVLKATLELGYPESGIVWIGVVLLACTLLYSVPRTSRLGAILLTGYLGGAIASQVRVGASGFNFGFALVFAALLWGGLWLRDIRVRNFVP
jgi:hypothetical protein